MAPSSLTCFYKTVQIISIAIVFSHFFPQNLALKLNFDLVSKLDLDIDLDLGLDLEIHINNNFYLDLMNLLFWSYANLISERTFLSGFPELS